MKTKIIELNESRYYVGLGDRVSGSIEEVDQALANGLIAAGLATEVKPPKEEKQEESSS